MQRGRLEVDGIGIAFVDQGEGDPILLIHGFASNLSVNWASTGWIDTLVRAGRRVVAFDNRGHGASDKLYDPDLYHPGLMARDAVNVMTQLGITRYDVMGYSMGARIGAFLALDQPDAVRSLVLGGLGMALVKGMNGGEDIAAALEASNVDTIADESGRMYRLFAERTNADLRALAACIRGSRAALMREQVAEIGAPVLVAVGTKDAVAGSADGLVRLMPTAEALDIPNKEHLPATGDKVFKSGVLEFLEKRP